MVSSPPEVVFNSAEGEGLPVVFMCEVLATPSVLPANLSWLGVDAQGNLAATPLPDEVTRVEGQRTVSVLSVNVTVDMPIRSIVCRATNVVGSIESSIDIAINGNERCLFVCCCLFFCYCCLLFVFFFVFLVFCCWFVLFFVCLVFFVFFLLLNVCFCQRFPSVLATPTITPPYVNQDEGGVLNLTCEATPSHPPPQFSWFRDSEQLTSDDSDQLTITTSLPLATLTGLYVGASSQLIVTDALLSYSGNYTCRTDQLTTRLNQPIRSTSEPVSVQINGQSLVLLYFEL